MYFIGDAFSRWDGFSFYASFSEFLPTVALAFILWTIIAAIFSFFLWIAFALITGILRIIGLKLVFEHLLLLAFFATLSGALVWAAKRQLWPEVQTSLKTKFIALICVALVSILVTWYQRNNAMGLTRLIEDRITPLVWIFGIFVMLSVPIVSYHAWFKDNDKALLTSQASDAVTSDIKPNIILVTFDALAARNMSTYGYSRDTTPFITEWAKNATLFSMTEAASNFTSPAAASLMTGKRLWTHQTYHIEGTKPLRSQKESFPQVLKESGYFNIALVVNPFAAVKILGMSNSFDIAPKITEFGNSVSLFGWKYGVIDKLLYRAFGENIKVHNWILKNNFIFGRVINLFSRNIYETTVPPRKVFERFLKIADNSMEKPFFAWLHLFPPHDPYLPPESFKGLFYEYSEMRSYKEQEHLIEESYKYLFKRQRYPEEMYSAVNLMRDYYDEFVTYIDNEFKSFIQELDKRDFKNTIIILTADHGESFEHGYFTHGGPFLYEQVTHIPLIIKLPGQKHRQVIDALVEQTDIAPTILNLSNISVPSWMEGRSLVPLMRGEKLPERPAFSMNFEENQSRGHQITKGSIAVWEGDYKLIHYLDKDESILFNLKEDPGELRNIIQDEPDVGRRLQQILMNELRQANERIVNPVRRPSPTP